MDFHKYATLLYEYVEMLRARLQQLTDDFTAYRQKEEQDKRVEVIIKVTSALFDKSSAYFNIIIVAGYVAFFTVWKIMQHLMSKEAMLWSALLISISCLVFIMWQIIVLIIHTLNSKMLAHAFQGPPETLMKRIEECQQRQSLNNIRLMKYWIWQLLLTVLPGLAGAIIMINSFLSSLIN